MSSVVYNGPKNFLERAETDGYFVAKGFFDRETVIQAKKELTRVIDKDEARRKANPKLPAADASVKYRSIYTKLMHSIWFPSMQSPAYLKLVNDMFSDDYFKSFMTGLAGDSIRLRIDLIRRSSGENDWVDDFQLPHVWHRDTLGEFTFGIFFDDLPEHGAGGTAVIPNTHFDARDPRWDLMLGPKNNMTRKHHLGNRSLLSLPAEYTDMAPLNRKLQAQSNAKKVEMTGQMGDIYFFLNDTWHGRAPNTSDKRWMISRFGGFGSEFPFKDDIPLPKGFFNLPKPWSQQFDTTPEPNLQANTLLRRVALRRKKNSLTHAAAREKDKVLKRFYAAPEQAAAVAALRAET